MRDLPAGKFTVAVDAPEGTDTEEITLTQGQNVSGVAPSRRRPIDTTPGRPPTEPTVCRDRTLAHKEGV